MSQQVRAVAVCRCSTEEESQKDALVQQVREAKLCIKEMGWDLVDTYVEAKSGTTVKGRKEYSRLLEDMVTDKFDVIVIKSIDRLMRNTKDWYLFLDRLQQNQKRLYMYLEKKFYTPDDSLITGIKAILAEEYSRELSKKIRNAHQHRQQEGNHFVITNSTYGYKNVNKETVIDTEDVSLIKRIFELAVEGYGSYVIAKMLYKEGYRNRKGGMIASHVVSRIIRNPIYVGDVILNKKHYDFETKRFINNPQSEWILKKNAVEPIISRELFELANSAVDTRSMVNKNQMKPASLGVHPLSGKLVCGLCGKAFTRCTRKSKGVQIAEWKCSTYVQRGRSSRFKGYQRKSVMSRDEGCDNIHINETKIYEVLKKFSTKQYSDFNEDKIIKFTSELLRGAIDETEYTNKKDELLEKINKFKNQKSTLLDKLLNEVITDSDYKEKSESIQSQIEIFTNELKKLDSIKASANSIKQRLEGIEKLLKDSIMEKAEVEHLLKCIRSIVVYPTEIQLHIDPLKFIDLSGDDNFKDIIDADEIVEVIPSDSMQAGIGYRVSKEMIIILDMMRRNPKVTAKQIAQENGWALSRVNRRIVELKKAAKLQYSSPNGKGYWIVK